ncbi:hypothetical protein PINS_up009290 [Pythium insidiosum]|nr:hypothetical protein PINS_up009290 [Pythium insidiosum]
MDMAACQRHWDVVRWLHENRSEGCSPLTLFIAMMDGHVSMVDSLLSGRPELVSWPEDMDASILMDLLASKSIKSTSMRSPLRVANAENRHVLRYLRGTRGMRCSGKLLARAVCGGLLADVRFLLEHDLCDRSTWAMDIAASLGLVTIVEYLFGHDIRPDAATAMEGAAEGGHIAVVRLLHDREALCSQLAIDLATKNGHLAVVEFLHTHLHLRPSKDVVQRAFDDGHEEVIQYLVGHGLAKSCPENHTGGDMKEGGDDAVIRDPVDQLQGINALGSSPRSTSVLDSLLGRLSSSA